MAKAKALEGISILPEPLIHHILSFLTTKEAAQTSVLSKSWLNTWRTRPTLELSDARFFSKEIEQRKKFRKYYMGFQWDNYEEERTRSEEFTAYIEGALRRYGEQNMIVDTFKLNLEHWVLDGKSIVQNCTKLALEYCVKNLELNIWKCSELPQSVFEAESLIGLHFVGYKSRLQSIEEVRCHRLKRLKLFNVGLDDAMLQKVISSCPLLEFLEIFNCDELRNIVVTNVSNLKQLIVVLDPEQTFEVEAPSLELLSCSNADEEYFEIPCWLTLHTPQYQNLKNLMIFGVGIYDNFFVNLANKFPHLEELSIDRCHCLRRIKISSHSIKVICLIYNWDLEEAQFDVPNIVRFEYECSKIRPELSFTAASAHWASDISILNIWKDVDFSWFIRLKQFLVKLMKSEISLTINFQDCSFGIDDEIRNNVNLPGPIEVQKLSVNFDRVKFGASNVDTIIDCLFSICHPKTIAIYGANCIQENQSLARSLYERLTIRKMEGQFSVLQQIKFLRHDNIRGWKVETFPPSLVHIWSDDE